jgi:coenzyme F420-reducing hydrogenase beta subunit
MIKINKPSDCCGCTACASICTHDAIRMLPDSMGFLYPKVDEDKCVDCGLCERVCQFNDNYDKSLNLDKPVAYAARHKDIKEIMKSRSGAAFVAVSDFILEQGGIVYGVGFKDHFRVAHKRAMTKEERDEFRGSKYVQSDLTGIFAQIKEDLKNGLTVLFSGTPCQTSGLNSFVGKKLRDNLFLMDIVCNGVPGPFLWRDYLDYLENKQGARISCVNFRDKDLYGWKAHHETFIFSDKQQKESFDFLFYQSIMFRYSCSNCHFSNLQRPSDITIADYWGWERTAPTFNADDKGCSLVLCNTEKGLKLFELVKEDMHTIPAELANVMQNHLLHSSSIHPYRMEFEKYYAERGFEYACKRCGLMGWRYVYNRFRKEVVATIRQIKYKLFN